MGVRSLLRQTLKLASTRLFQLVPGILGDGRLDRTLSVKRNGKVIFHVRDFGEITRMRARTFESKEPETLRWIDGFPAGSALLDVGANVGVYSLYAVAVGHDVVAVEPDALNIALLHENIRLNQTHSTNRLRAYPIALHDKFRISDLNVTGGEWGAALSSFDNTINFKGDTFRPLFSQGCIGVCLDDFLHEIKFLPTHIKIDVDGNEINVLRGASRTLASDQLQSILVELDERRPDYEECLRLIAMSGLSLVEKSHGVAVASTAFAGSYNHIFRR